MDGLVLGAFVAGLVGSPHCVGMCGAFASACARPASHGAAYHLGRLTTYAALGATVGALGARLPGPGWIPTLLAGGLTLWFALSLAGLAPSWAPTLPGLQKAASSALSKGGALGAYGLGATTALLPCGLVWAALGMPLGVGTALGGATTMIAFGLGTVPLLAAASVGLRRLVAGRPWARRALAALVLLASWGTLAMRHQMQATHEPAVEAEAP